MNPAWSIYSGGRLHKEGTDNVSFRIILKDMPGNLLPSSLGVTQSLRDKLQQQLSCLVVDNLTLRTLSMAIQFELVTGETGVLEVELLVWVSEMECDSMLWYFMLRSPADNISPGNLDEIATLIVDRLFAKKEIKYTSID